MGHDTRTREILRAVSRQAGWEILLALRQGPTRFSELEEGTQVSPRTLSERLRELVELGLVGRRAFAEVPPRVEYTLTPLGLKLLEALEGLESLIEPNRSE
jgi:DNA-binding HxlR family transcriptional regulator